MTEARVTRVIGVDPGTTTGIAVVEFTSGQDPFLLLGRQLPWDPAAVAVFGQVELAARYRPSVAVCEAYTLTSRSAQRGQSGAEDAMEMNGVVRYACLLYGVDFAPRQKSASKKAATDASLKAAGLWQRGKPHVNDAIRHCLVYGMRKRLFDLTVMVP